MLGSITFRGAELVLPDGVFTGDLSIHDGRIEAVGRVEVPRGEQVDARGLTLLPGVIDPQVHFREPGLEHKEDLKSGSESAAAGGVTAFFEMPNTRPPTTSAAALAQKVARGAGRCRAHFGFFFGASTDNFEATAALRDETPGIKIFMGSSTGTLLVDEQAALERHFAGAQVPVVVHAEDETRLRARSAEFAGARDPAMHPTIRDEITALRATARAVDLADRHHKRLHVLHVSTAEEVDFLREHGSRGRITAETLPQYLFLDARDYARLGTHLQMNPPVRDLRHQHALWAGLLDGTIDCMATDHAPHTLEEKALPFGQAPSGLPGVQTLVPMMLEGVHRGRCTLTHLARWMSEAPARIYGLPRKGRLSVGFDGDLTVVDRRAVHTIRGDALLSKAGWTPFEGMEVHGWPVMTVLAGRPVWREGSFIDGVYGAPLRFAHSARLPGQETRL